MGAAGVCAIAGPEQSNNNKILTKYLIFFFHSLRFSRRSPAQVKTGYFP
jgi:hypothetical protein